MDPLKPYFTLVLPFVAVNPFSLPCDRRGFPWYPTSSEGPFATLTRGAFATIEEAIAWARENLNGFPYTIKTIPAFDPESDE